MESDIMHYDNIPTKILKQYIKIPKELFKMRKYLGQKKKKEIKDICIVKIVTYMLKIYDNIWNL